jgi:AraC-like DNA-binding protein
MNRGVEELNLRMLRARDEMDRSYAEPLDVRRLAAVAYVSEAHFIRTFRATFGETPHRYLQRRRVERAMYMLVQTRREITEISFEVGFDSPATFSRTFHKIVGESPRSFRAHAKPIPVPNCFAMAWMRPSSFGQVPNAAGR